MICRQLRAKISSPLAAQSKYLEMYKDASLDWKEKYMLPFQNTRISIHEYSSQ